MNKNLVLLYLVCAALAAAVVYSTDAKATVEKIIAAHRPSPT